MFLRPPFHGTAHLQQVALLLNTIILIISLIAAELLYAELPKSKRRELRYFYPLFVLLGGLLAYAVYKQVKPS